LHFLAEEWKKQDHAERIAGHKLYLGLEDKAWLYTARGDKVIRQDITELECSHEEADTWMVWHVNLQTQQDICCLFLVPFRQLPVSLYLR